MKTKDIVIITIFTIVLSIIGTIAGIFISLYISRSVYTNYNAWIIVYFVILHLIHELTHYVYLYAIGAARNSVISYKLSFKYLSLWFYTSRELPKNSTAVYLILPAITTTVFSLIVIMNSLNISYSALLGYSFALSSLDLFLLYRLKKMNCTHVSFSPDTPIIEEAYL